jgi:hypothetical protein
VAGPVAPVSKTVSYGTVSYVPGEASKCWITSNLGSSQQAIAVSDATEASAGWYWQFNRKQGFKHDGTTLTPGSSSWVSNINENSDWATANDPCTIELGSNWRIPTSTEWTNADASGSWTNWTGPWGSLLKLHAAGFLNNGDGSLSSRGTAGYYSSSTQSGNYNNMTLSFFSSQSDVSVMGKLYGAPIRCLMNAGTFVSAPTLTTAGITGITLNSATSGGDVTSDGGSPVTSRGICWNTTASPTILTGSFLANGSGTGAFVIEMTGLTTATVYYVRAYATTSNGTSYGNEVSFVTASPAWSCGLTFGKIHVAGAVAPVNKTVNYGTVTNVPGEPSKCWITQNLGSDHQATSMNDATEASAGWYWQFNLKQGYKHDGSSRTPNTAWITSISENSDWMAANDPCTIELGSTWRVPTTAELTNVDAAGSWTDWNGPWNSLLKMHAAGFITAGPGLLYYRGTYGDYWSSGQETPELGDILDFSTSGSAVAYTGKWVGVTLRCIK